MDPGPRSFHIFFVPLFLPVFLGVSFLSFLLLLLYFSSPSVNKIRYQAGFDVLTVATMKIAVFWDVTPCILLKRYQRLGGTCYSIFSVGERCLFNLEEGHKKFLRNADIMVTSYQRRQ
jgi:hypothetical protein